METSVIVKGTNPSSQAILLMAAVVEYMLGFAINMRNEPFVTALRAVQQGADSWRLEATARSCTMYGRPKYTLLRTGKSCPQQASNSLHEQPDTAGLEPNPTHLTVQEKVVPS